MKALFLTLILTTVLSAQSVIRPDTGLLRTHVQALVNTSKPRNFKNPEILDSVARYIKGEFKKYGYTGIREQTYGVKENEYRNIMVSIGPENTETIVIGAHYDVFSDLPGADDNASGIAGLLECARILYESKDKLKNRVEFVAYTLEEPPFFNTKFMGSYVHASYLSDYNTSVKLMICFEMIGYYCDDKKTQDYPLGILKPFYGSRGNYVSCVADFRTGGYARKLNKIFNKQVKLKSKCLISPRFIPGIGFSDHRNYWGYKMKALMITDTAFYKNKNYHTINDTIDNLNFEKMSDVVMGAVLLVMQI